MDRSDIDLYQSIVVTGKTDPPSANLSNKHLFSQFCQVCGVFLKIDPNILNMNEATYKQLSNPFSCRDDLETTLSGNIDPDMELSLSAIVGTLNTDTERSSNTNYDEDVESSTKVFEPLYRKSIPPKSFYLCPTTINIAESNSNNQSTANNDLMTGWSARINATSALFDMMSSNTNIDHPLCEECADQLLNQLDQQCKIVEKEHQDYKELLERFNNQVSNDKEMNDLENELKQLELEEQELLNELEKAEQTEQDLLKERDEKLLEESNLIQQEQAYLLEYSNLKRQLLKLEEKQESLDNQLRNTQYHFKRLRSVNVLNATFHIWHSGPFGTINFFRLGCLPGTPVEWEEINAGLGQANLLLYCLAKKVKLEFKKFRLVPFGSYSYIEVIENSPNFRIGDELNMYRLKGYKYYFDWDKKFEKGMIAFLDCLKQFEEKIKSIDSQFTMPYKINGHKLEDKNASSYSIKFQLNSFEEWTKALKYMLTNLKWSLAWVTSQSENTLN